MTVAAVERHELAEVPAVSWTYDPWSERPRVAWLAALVAFCLCVLVLASRESLLVSLGLCLFCVGAFAPVLSRVECRIDSAGVARRGWLGWENRSWDSLRRFDRLPAGVLVSPYPKRSFLDGARGLVLPMPDARREELTRLVADRLGAAR